LYFFSFTLARPPRSPLFPYTTLFRSPATPGGVAVVRIDLVALRLDGRIRFLPENIDDVHLAALSDTLAIAYDARGARVRQLDLRSEEHTSELQSLRHLVCRLLLEKKK